MTRHLPAWTRTVALMALAATLGVAAGIIIAPQRPPTHLAYCAADGSAGLYPCPPDTDRWVQAYWGNTTAVAKWRGSYWAFQTPVLGVKTTVYPPLAWHELPAARP